MAVTEIRSLSRDNFGNPIYGSISFNDSTGKRVSFEDVIKEKFIEGKALDGTEATISSFLEALMHRWHHYGIQNYQEWAEDKDNRLIGQLTVIWVKDLMYEANALWRRYKSIVEAYKTKVDWASGIINTTTYKDVKDTSVNNGESTDWALPNKKVESPYGTPTSHAENKGGNTNTKTGAVETKGMLNPVTQRDLYARLIRDAFGEMAEECSPLFNQMHL